MSRQPRLNVHSAVNDLVAGATFNTAHKGLDLHQRPVEYAGPGIVIVWCSRQEVNACFDDAKDGFWMYDRSVGNHIWGKSHVLSGPRIVEARSQYTEAFLTNKTLAKNGRMPEWLVSIDTDMDADVDAVHRLVDSAIRHNAKIMGALCIGGGYSGMFPTLYQLTRLPNGDLDQERITEWPEGAVVKVDGTGAAFLAVHKDVLWAMAKAYAKLPDGSPEPHPWWIEGRRKGNQYGEDIGFCMRAKALGFNIYVDTSISIGHEKNFLMTEKMWRDNQP